MSKRLWLTETTVRKLIEHARTGAPDEVCGLIAATADAQEVIPVPNAAPDRQHQFYLDERAFVEAIFDLDRRRLSLAAIYHSHPDGDAIPSPVDIRQANYPETPYLIVGLQYAEPRLAAWQIARGEVSRVELHIGNDPPPEAEDLSLSSAQKVAILLSALIAFLFLIVLSLSLLPPAPPIPLR